MLATPILSVGAEQVQLDANAIKVDIISENIDIHNNQVVASKVANGNPVKLYLQESLQYTPETNTALVVEKSFFDNIPKEDKADIKELIKEELNNKKQIIFYGDKDTLSTDDILATIDEEKTAEVSPARESLDKLAAISVTKENDKNVICFHLANKDASDAEKISGIVDSMNIEYQQSYTQETASDETISSQIELDPYSIASDATYRVQNSYPGFYGKTTYYWSRKFVGSKGTYWEFKLNIEMQPYSPFRTRYVTCIFDSRSEEIKHEVWPTTHVGGGSVTHSFNTGFNSGLSIGTNMSASFGSSLGAGFSYSNNFNDIEVKSMLVDGPNSNGIIFDYQEGWKSNAAIYQTMLEAGACYSNEKGSVDMEFVTYYNASRYGLFGVVLEDQGDNNILDVKILDLKTGKN